MSVGGFAFFVFPTPLKEHLPLRRVLFAYRPAITMMIIIIVK